MIDVAKINHYAVELIKELVGCDYSDDDSNNWMPVALGEIRGIICLAEELKYCIMEENNSDNVKNKYAKYKTDVEDGCFDCKYQNIDEDEEPCLHCALLQPFRWEPKES